MDPVCSVWHPFLINRPHHVMLFFNNLSRWWFQISFIIPTWGDSNGLKLNHQLPVVCQENQLQLMCELLGTPSPRIWPGVEKMPCLGTLGSWTPLCNIRQIWNQGSPACSQNTWLIEIRYLDVPLEVIGSMLRINGWNNLLINGRYCGYNPLILTFDPNFLGHPSIYLGIFWGCNRSEKRCVARWFLGMMFLLVMFIAVSGLSLSSTPMTDPWDWCIYLHENHKISYSCPIEHLFDTFGGKHVFLLKN